jgi:hypothetical protein
MGRYQLLNLFISVKGKKKYMMHLRAYPVRFKSRIFITYVLKPDQKNKFSAIPVDLNFILDIYDALSYIYSMKVTALIPDDLVKDVKQYAGGKNITESLITALEEWLSLKKIQYLNEDIVKKPLEFSKDFSASKNREMNRKR